MQDAEDQPRERSRFDRALPALVLLAMTAVLIALTVIIGSVSFNTPDWMQSEGGSGGPTDPVATINWPTDTPTELTTPNEPTDTDIPFAQIFLAIAIIATVWVVLVIVRRLNIRPRKRPVTGGEVTIDDTADNLHKAAEDAGAALRTTSASPPDAIIQAWLTLEAAAEESGHPRKASETPSEFTAELLRHYHADPDAVGRLLALYHRARFSTHPDLSPGDAHSAQEALDAIVATLATSRSAQS